MAIQFTVRFVCVCVNILCNMLLIKHRYYLVFVIVIVMYTGEGTKFRHNFLHTIHNSITSAN